MTYEATAVIIVAATAETEYMIPKNSPRKTIALFMAKPVPETRKYRGRVFLWVVLLLKVQFLCREYETKKPAA